MLCLFQKIPDDWIGKVHTFLNSKTDRYFDITVLTENYPLLFEVLLSCQVQIRLVFFTSWLGVCLLGVTIEQCDTDTFTKHCASWLRTILQIIQVKKCLVMQCLITLPEKPFFHLLDFGILEKDSA